MTRALLAILAVVVFAPPLQAYTPESVEVRQMVDRAVDFLDARASKSSGGYDSELGARCVAALAHLQATGVADHPLV